MHTIKGLLFDIGGVLYVGNTMIPGADLTLTHLQKAFPIRFITNTTRQLPHTIYDKLSEMGFMVEQEQIFTALDATKAYIQKEGGMVFTLLTDEAKAYFSDYESDKGDFVIVGDAYTNFDYAHLNGAFRALENGAKLIACATNRSFLDSDGIRSMDAGGFVAALEFAAQTKATVIGKPSRDFFHLAARSMRLHPSEILMIGDDIESDIKGAKDAGMQAALVKTGKFHPSDLDKAIEPDYILEDLTGVVSILM